MASPLTSLIIGPGRADAEILATGPGGSLDWRSFRHQVGQKEEHLATLPPGPVAINQPGPCVFLAWLWAVWRQNRIAVISASGFRDLAHALTSPVIDGACATPFDPAALPATLPDDTALILFTSGSSGTPQAVPKSLAQLDAELALLDGLWGGSVAGTLMVNMVSHHHMFGLPFGLLWPLSRGVTLHTRTLHHPEPIERLAGEQRLTLVCSPVHLRHFPAHLDSARLHGRIARVFSAGSALSADDAARCLALFGKPVTEIYGSTETGAVAWREQPATTHWRCLPGIVVDHPPSVGADIGAGAIAPDTFASQALAADMPRPLRIHSPTLAGDEPLVTADLGRIHSPAGFFLDGRSDRIAKVGGKRVSLTALENALACHPWVREARLVPLAERKGRLGAVLILTREGNAALIDRGRQVVNSLLREHVSGPLEPVALPRYWRYVTRMPLNSQGKTTADALTDLFVTGRQSRFATLLDSEELASGRHWRLHLHIPDNLFYFNGHFPGNPVLPGVVQTHWAIHYARQRFAGLDAFVALEAVKFQHIIQPGALVSLDLQWQPDRSRLQFSYQSRRARHASGRVLFRPGACHGD